MARKKFVKPKWKLVMQPFNPERPDKWGMKMAVPFYPDPAPRGAAKRKAYVPKRREPAVDGYVRITKLVPKGTKHNPYKVF